MLDDIKLFKLIKENGAISSENEISDTIVIVLNKVHDVKKYFKENDLQRASKSYSDIYDILQNEQICNYVMDSFTDDEIYKIADYIKEREYKKYEKI